MLNAVPRRWMRSARLMKGQSTTRLLKNKWQVCCARPGTVLIYRSDVRVTESILLSSIPKRQDIMLLVLSVMELAIIARLLPERGIAYESKCWKSLVGSCIEYGVRLVPITFKAGREVVSSS